MAIHWQVKFKSLRAGTDYTVNIYDENYSGNPIPLKGGAEPFVTQEDDVVTVTFYRKTGINAVPKHLEFGAAGGTQTIEIWSRTGEVILRINPTYDWLDYQQVSSTPIVGTEYHKYTYNIICSANSTGNERTGVLDVGIEYGQGVGETIQVSVTQSA